jgi:galactokinase
MAPRDLVLEARAQLEGRFGGGPTPSAAIAPGRITLVGEHVDYVGGKVACMAINLHVAAATRPSPDRMWRVISRDRMIERPDPTMNRDIGDRVFAACLAASELTGEKAPVEIAVAADLPEGAGLSSSAAVVCATLVAQLKRRRARVTPEQLVRLATRAEREIAGIPCGDMDQWAVVASRERQVLIFDAHLNTAHFVPWPWPDLVMIVAGTGESHDVGGEGYRARRTEAETVLRRLGVESCQAIGDRWQEIKDEPLRSRARHIATETRRTDHALIALRDGDSGELGALISASGRSLDEDYDVSTVNARALIVAALNRPGCLGARLVGGGFGGSVMVLCRRNAVADIRQVMVSAGCRTDFEGSWEVEPGEGIAPSLSSSYTN